MARKGRLEPTDYMQTGPIGTFTPEGAFNPTPEAKRVLDYLQTRYGKTIDIRPVPGASDPSVSVGGYFRQHGPGGSADPVNRTIYLNPYKADLSVLTHEAGHAFDPDLLRVETAYQASIPAQIQRFGADFANKNPTSFLYNYMKGPQTLAKQETEAQRASAQFLEDVGYPTANLRKEPSFRGYPYSFIDTGLAQAAANYSFPRNVPAEAAHSFQMDRRSNLQSMGQNDVSAGLRWRPESDDHVEFDFSDAFAQNMLDLALDERYRRAEASMRDRAKQDIEKVLK